MNSTSLGFLKELLATSTPTGSEQEGQKVVASYMGRFADQVETDVHGNVHGVLNPGNDFRVMLAGHCDEIGLMVQHVDDKGFIYVSPLGGVNVPLLQGERLIVYGSKGPVRGVIGVKPVHLMDAKERESAVGKIHEIWVDIGAKSRKDAESAVTVGDVATIDAGWRELRNGRVACRGFDDRIGAFVVADTLRLLKDRKINVSLHAVTTVQEEIGLRGAKTAAFAVDPTLGIAVDVTHASDYPSVNEKISGRVTLGDGPVLRRGPAYNPRLLSMIEKAAKKARVKTQLQPDARGHNTDAYALQMTRAGVAAGLVSIPNRYMHSPVETIALRDAENAVKLLAELVASLKATEKFS